MSYELGTAGWASLHLKCGETEFTIPDFGSLTDGRATLLELLWR